MILQPVSDEEWHGKGLLKIKELVGEEVPHTASFWSFLMTPFEAFRNSVLQKVYLDTLMRMDRKTSPKIIGCL